jgi:hypothetical protein
MDYLQVVSKCYTVGEVQTGDSYFADALESYTVGEVENDISRLYRLSS